MSEYVSPKIASHLRNLARDVAYTEGHAFVMRAAAYRIESLEARLARVKAWASVRPDGYGDYYAGIDHSQDAVLELIRAVAADEQGATDD